MDNIGHCIGLTVIHGTIQVAGVDALRQSKAANFSTHYCTYYLFGKTQTQSLKSNTIIRDSLLYIDIETQAKNCRKYPKKDIIDNKIK